MLRGGNNLFCLIEYMQVERNKSKGHGKIQ